MSKRLTAIPQIPKSKRLNVHFCPYQVLDQPDLEVGFLCRPVVESLKKKSASSVQELQFDLLVVWGLATGSLGPGAVYPVDLRFQLYAARMVYLVALYIVHSTYYTFHTIRS